MSELASNISSTRNTVPSGNDKEKAENSRKVEVEAEEEVDIDLNAPETEKAAQAIQKQFRRFQKRKNDPAT
ncbi:Purkinje cell protein 4-like protein 1 [Latimeria chalumnae]|uniref:Purkinje cell protein 4-like protein 1 n=1 Tax=Latimeria chalumnae TaxID=7897 RepID=UPI00313C24EC